MNNFSNASKEIQDMAIYLASLPPEQFTLLAFTLGYVIAPNLTVNQQNSVGNFLILFGQVLLTFNAQSNYIVNLKPSNE